MTLGVLSAVQSIVIIYGLEKFYQTFSRFWAVVKDIFNLLKSKIGTKRKVEEEKEKRKNIQLKTRKSSLKRFGANTINCVC